MGRLFEVGQLTAEPSPRPIPIPLGATGALSVRRGAAIETLRSSNGCGRGAMMQAVREAALRPAAAGFYSFLPARDPGVPAAHPG